MVEPGSKTFQYGAWSMEQSTLSRIRTQHSASLTALIDQGISATEAHTVHFLFMHARPGCLVCPTVLGQFWQLSHQSNVNGTWKYKRVCFSQTKEIRCKSTFTWLCAFLYNGKHSTYSCCRITVIFIEVRERNLLSEVKMYNSIQCVLVILRLV